MIQIGEIIKESIPSSFVQNSIKIRSDRGSGEAKFHLGSASKADEFSEFFNGYNVSNKYIFQKNNMIEFMKSLKIEYVYQSINQYKNANLEYYQLWYDRISNMENDDFEFSLSSFIDASRYYIRSDNDIFKTVFRKIALPLVSNLKIVKFDLEDGRFEYHFLLEINLNSRRQSQEDEEDTETDNHQLLHNRIVFGAPGTGKSFKLEKDRVVFGENYERVTFHPNYSYSQFVGSYKPIPKIRTNGDEYVSYEFVSGPFLRTWINAQNSLKNNDGKIHLLIIEEINRSNVAAVFGDVFQLLDRKADGTSEYEISTNEEMRKYLIDKHHFTLDEVASIKLPSNMYLWATMNSADQGVTPVDSAFKRRWHFEYTGINECMDEISGKDINLVPYGIVEWNQLRIKINDRLTQPDLNINEDKLIGPFFLSEKELESRNINFIFKSKLLMYLYEDVLKHRKGKFFRSDLNTLSKVFEAYEKGENVFDFEITSEIPSDSEDIAEAMVAQENNTGNE